MDLATETALMHSAEPLTFALLGSLWLLYTAARYWCAFNKDYLTRVEIRREMEDNAENWMLCMWLSVAGLIVCFGLGLYMLALLSLLVALSVMAQRLVVEFNFFEK